MQEARHRTWRNKPRQKHNLKKMRAIIPRQLIRRRATHDLSKGSEWWKQGGMINSCMTER